MASVAVEESYAILLSLNFLAEQIQNLKSGRILENVSPSPSPSPSPSSQFLTIMANQNNPVSTETENRKTPNIELLKLLKEKGFESEEDYRKNNERKMKIYLELSKIYNNKRVEFINKYNGKFIVINEKGEVEKETHDIKEWEDYKITIPLQRAYFDTKVGQEEGYSISRAFQFATLSINNIIPFHRRDGQVVYWNGLLSIQIEVENVNPYAHMFPKITKRIAIDTGATATMLDNEISTRLYADVLSNQGFQQVWGIGGEILVTKAKVRITIHPYNNNEAPFRRDCVVALLDSNLFGLDLLNNFKVNLNFLTNEFNIQW